MRRVVITGMGIVSPLGDSVAAVLDASARPARASVSMNPTGRWACAPTSAASPGWT